jgi:hypothetical protein
MKRNNMSNETINIIENKYEQTGASKRLNEFGMREMQQRAYEKRNSKYLLIKAPPASGKSRALMFIALDKLVNQGLKKQLLLSLKHLSVLRFLILS